MPRCVLTDLDRTLTTADLALDPRVPPRIAQLRASGVKVAIVTGRRLDEVAAMGLVDRVDGVVAEDGAVALVPRPEWLDVAGVGFAAAARDALRDLAPWFRWGRVVGSGPRELAPAAAARLDRAGVPHALSFNAEQVMLLPPGVDKGAGALRLLARLDVRPPDAWAIGDGENDAPLLAVAGLGAAPANAHPAALRAASVRIASSYANAFLDLTAPLVPSDATAPGSA